MENYNILLGKILGEIYRLQKKNGVDNGTSSGRIYGLLHGFEDAINQEMDSIGFMSNEKKNVLTRILDEYYDDPEKLNAFSGFYEIEDKLRNVGIDRSDAMIILRYLYADGSYEELIEKMDSGGSPTECRKFKLYDWDK